MLFDKAFYSSSSRLISLQFSRSFVRRHRDEAARNNSRETHRSKWFDIPMPLVNQANHS
jgi:hypothetical protein